MSDMAAFVEPRFMLFTIWHEQLGTTRIATWVFPPQRPSAIWCVGIPSGSYTGLGYYDRQVPGKPAESYSMARYFARNGIGFAAIDNIGTGGSSTEKEVDGGTLTGPLLANVYSQFVATLREAMVQGSLAQGVGVPAGVQPWIAGMGHSMGGYLLTQTQGAYGSFDAAIFLGWPQGAWDPELVAFLDQTVRLWKDDNGYLMQERVSMQCFYPQALIVADEGDTTILPAGLMRDLVPPDEGSLVQQLAAAISVPVYLGFGASLDAPADPYRELWFYQSAPSIKLFFQEHAAHCANFSESPERLWRDLAVWIQWQASNRREPEGETQLKFKSRSDASD